MSKVIVAGSINMDIITRVERLPLAGETVAGTCVEYLPGGKGLNQAVASAKMNAETILVGALGNDSFAHTLRDFLNQQHINTNFLKQSNRESGTAFITVDVNGRNTIVVVPGSNSAVNEADFTDLEINPGDVVISQFEIPLKAIIAFFQRAKKAQALTILNPSPVQFIPPELLRLTDYLIINETELAFLSKHPVTKSFDLAEITDAAEKIKASPHQTIIITLGHQGALIVGQTTSHTPGHSVIAVDTVGAGDCFAGVVASRLAQHQPLADCVTLANRAAALCVTRKGAAPAMPCASELDMVPQT